MVMVASGEFAADETDTEEGFKVGFEEFLKVTLFGKGGGFDLADRLVVINPIEWHLEPSL